MGVSKNLGTPKWMVYNGKPYWKGWFGGKTHYFWKHPYISSGWDQCIQATPRPRYLWSCITGISGTAAVMNWRSSETSDAFQNAWNLDATIFAPENGYFGKLYIHVGFFLPIFRGVGAFVSREGISPILLDKTPWVQRLQSLPWVQKQRPSTWIWGWTKALLLCFDLAKFLGISGKLHFWLRSLRWWDN